VVAKVLEPPPLPPDPQADAAIESRPLLSVWTQRVPEPARLETVRALEVKLPNEARLERNSVEEASPETNKLVVVALVPVALAKLKLVSVDDAVERKPFKNARVVEVACSLVPSLVKGKAKDMEER
jgi:hypothetical protein